MRLNIPRVVLVIALLAAGGSWRLSSNAQGVTEAERLLQKAILLETVDGNLQAAIEQYKKIVAQNGSNRAVAAKALLRLAGCYEKLGQNEAGKTYQQLINDYADQTAEVNLAKQKLAALAATEAKPRFTKIRVPTGLPDNARCALSPDGQQLAYLSGGSVWLVPVHGATDPAITGAPRQISQPITSWSEATDIVWSGDGNWLALHVRERDAAKYEYAVYVLRATGGEPRHVSLGLKSRERVFHDSRLSLSPDGRWLAYTTWPEGGSPAERSVYVAPTDGGPARRLSQPITSDPAFSPDGKRIAYLGLVADPDWGTGGERGRQLWIRPLDGGTPVLAYELARPGRIAGPTWSLDGKTVAVLVNSVNLLDGCREILLIPIGPDGRASGPPRRLTLPYEVAQYMAGWASGDQIGLILRKPEEGAIYTVPSSGGKAVQLTPPWAQMPSWTPDGQMIYFAGDHFDRIAALEYIPSRGGKIERLLLRAPGPDPLHLSYPGTGISVSPDGKRILFMASYRGAAKRVAQIFTIPVEGGDVAALTGGMPATNPCWSPDGASIAYIGWQEVGNNKYTRDIYTVPAGGGQPRKLTAQPDQVAYAGIAWSPDGSQIAFHSDEGRRIKLVPVAGGPVRNLVEGLSGNRSIASVAWSPDGRQLLYSTENRIWKLNLETGRSEEVPTGLKVNHVDPAWSPDGKTIAFAGLQDGENEFWLMEDFLSSAWQTFKKGRLAAGSGR
jgi:Tol biopolymer transport system component